MTWSYSGDPSTTDKDAVRFTIGDTDTNDQQIQDEEIDYLLVTFLTVVSASIAAAEALCAKFSRLVDEVTGDLSRKCSKKAEAYKALAKQLKDRADDLTFNNPIAFAGGVSCADIENREQDTDRFPDIFQIGDFDNERGPTNKALRPKES